MDALQDLTSLINRVLSTHRFIEDKAYSITEDCDLFGFCLDQNVYREWEFNDGSRSIFTAMIRNDNWNNPGSVPLMLRTFNISDEFSSFNSSEFGIVSVDKLRDSMKEYQVDKLIERGKSFLQSRQFSLAMESFNTALQISPKCIPALKYRAHIYLHCSNFSDAKKDIMTILSETPDDMEGLKLWTELPNSLTSIETTVNASSRYTPTINRLSESLERIQKSYRTDCSSSNSDTETTSSSENSKESSNNRNNKRKRSKKRRKSKHKRKDKHKRGKKHKKDDRY